MAINLSIVDCGLVGKDQSDEVFISQVRDGCETQITEEAITVTGKCFKHKDIVFKPFSFFRV